MAGSIGQLSELATLAQSFQSVDVDDVIDGIAQSISAQASRSIASAVTELRDAGLEPSDYIAMPRSAMRAKQQMQRLAIEQARADAELKHIQAMQELELRERAAEVKLVEQTVRDA